MHHNKVVIMVFVICLMFLMACSDSNVTSEMDKQENNTQAVLEDNESTEPQENNIEVAEAVESNETVESEEDVENYVRVLSDTLNVRSSYSLESDVIGKAIEGDVFLLMDTQEDDQNHKWYQVEYEGVTGFISSMYSMQISDYNATQTVPYVLIIGDFDVGIDPKDRGGYYYHLKEKEYEILETYLSDDNNIWYKIAYEFDHFFWISGLNLAEAARSTAQYPINIVEEKIIENCENMIGHYYDTDKAQVKYWVQPSDDNTIHIAYIPNEYRPAHYMFNDDEQNLIEKKSKFEFDEETGLGSVVTILQCYSSLGERLYHLDTSIARIKFDFSYIENDFEILKITTTRKYRVDKLHKGRYGQTIEDFDIGFYSTLEDIKKELNLSDSEITFDGNYLYKIRQNGLLMTYYDDPGTMGHGVGDVTLYDEGYSTNFGLHVGMTLDEVLSIMGDPNNGFADTEELFYETPAYATYRNDKNMGAEYINITVDHGIVTSIQFGIRIW